MRGSRNLKTVKHTYIIHTCLMNVRMIPHVYVRKCICLQLFVLVCMGICASFLFDVCGSFVEQFSLTVSNLHIISSISLRLIFFTLKYFDVPWVKGIFVSCFLVLDFLLFFWFLNVYFHDGFKYLGWQGSAYVIFLIFSLMAFIRPATRHYNTIRPTVSNELLTRFRESLPLYSIDLFWLHYNT